jgi:hypothetical protein
MIRQHDDDFFPDNASLANTKKNDLLGMMKVRTSASLT